MEFRSFPCILEVVNIIWTYWHQGFKKAPEIVRQCASQLEVLNPDYKVYLLEASNVREFLHPLEISFATWDEISLAHRSDIIRTQLLIKYGGVWVDPTVFCLKPLNEWLPAAVKKAGIFFFYKPGRDRIISNWLIAAEKQNPLLIRTNEELCAYWNSNTFRNMGKAPTRAESLIKRIITRNLDWPMIWFHPLFTKVFRLYPYMVYHYMIYKLIREDEALKRIFESMPKISADGPHLLQRKGMLNELDFDIKEIIDQKKQPLFKLNWKIHQTSIPHDSNLGYLFNKST